MDAIGLRKAARAEARGSEHKYGKRSGVVSRKVMSLFFPPGQGGIEGGPSDRKDLPQPLVIKEGRSGTDTTFLETALAFRPGLAIARGEEAFRFADQVQAGLDIHASPAGVRERRRAGCAIRWVHRKKRGTLLIPVRAWLTRRSRRPPSRPWPRWSVHLVPFRRVISGVPPGLVCI